VTTCQLLTIGRKTCQSGNPKEEEKIFAPCCISFEKRGFGNLAEKKAHNVRSQDSKVSDGNQLILSLTAKKILLPHQKDLTYL